MANSSGTNYVIVLVFFFIGTNAEVTNLSANTNLDDIMSHFQSLDPTLDIFNGHLMKILTSSSERQTSNLINYSGMGIGQLGDYKACKNTNDSYYVTAALGYYYTAAWVGLCLPKEMTIEILRSQRKSISEALETIANISLSITDIEFFDVKKINDKARDIGLGYISFWLMIIIAVFILAMASIL